MKTFILLTLLIANTAMAKTFFPNTPMALIWCEFDGGRFDFEIWYAENDSFKIEDFRLSSGGNSLPLEAKVATVAGPLSDHDYLPFSSLNAELSTGETFTFFSLDGKNYSLKGLGEMADKSDALICETARTKPGVIISN